MDQASPPALRYAALGDSFTEGVGDELPDGSVRGWADVLASHLANATGQPIGFANLAVRGRLLTPIVTEQLDSALSLRPLPTMLTLNGGGNNMLRPGMDADHLVALTEGAVQRCLAVGVHPVLLSGPDPSERLPMGGTFRKRGEVLTAAIIDLSRRYDITVIDIFHDEQIRAAGYWSHDRLHLNPAGHRRVADLVLAGLGYPAPADTLEPAGPHPSGPLAEVRYYREHVVPWVQRRLRGESSGDGRTGKHDDWVEVLPES